MIKISGFTNLHAFLKCQRRAFLRDCRVNGENQKEFAAVIQARNLKVEC